MAYKIALTSSDGKTIDLHFGQTRSFVIMEVDEKAASWRFLEERNLSPPAEEPPALLCDEPASGCLRRNGQLAAAAGLLSGCAYVLTAKIGPKAQAFLKRAAITALESPRELSAAIPKLNAYHLKYANINRSTNNGK